MPSIEERHAVSNGSAILPPGESVNKRAEAKAADEISRLTLRFIDAIVRRKDLTGPDSFDRLAPRLNMQSARFDPTFTREAFLRDAELRRQVFPDWSVDVIDVQVTDIDLRFGGRAKIMVWERVTGAPTTIVYVGVSVYEWKKERGEWVCHSIRSVKMPVPGT